VVPSKVKRSGEELPSTEVKKSKQEEPK
jgi:hypothetical protein